MTKLTNEQIEKGELYSLGEAIGNCLELNTEFLASCCGKTVADLLRQLPEEKREFALQGCIGEGHFPGGVWHDDPECILLPHGEIEYPFEGDSAEVFETPNELTIHGDLAYLYTGYGARFPIDCIELARNVKEALEKS